MPQAVTGTFAGTGESPEVSCSHAIIDLTFAGTATVAVQWSVDGTNFRTIDTPYTASAQVVFNPGQPCKMRLSCTAHTNNVTYAIQPR